MDHMRSCGLADSGDLIRLLFSHEGTVSQRGNAVGVAIRSRGECAFSDFSWKHGACFSGCSVTSAVAVAISCAMKNRQICFLQPESGGGAQRLLAVTPP